MLTDSWCYSTVSKVLRHKDQYLKRDQEPEVSSAKRVKGKHPDFDRTLSNYIKRMQSSGLEVKDEDIMEQAKLFASASDNQESLLGSLTGPWLQKFKQKHGVGAGKLTRRASETNIPDSTRMTSRPKLKKEKSTSSISRSRPKKERPSSVIISPVSPTAQMSPLSESRSDEEMHPEGLGLDFSYSQAASHSTTSLTNDTVNSSFSGGALSPTGTFTFSPDPNTGVFPFEHHREKRSNTFPSLKLDGIHPSSIEPMTPRHAQPVTASSSAMASPAQELKAGVTPIDTTVTSPPMLHRSGSNSSMTGPVTGSTVNSVNSTSIDSSPVSPSHDDARRAANTLLSYIQSMSSNGQFDQSEYMAIVQLNKKLHQNHLTPRASIGGLSRIPEGDNEMSASHGMVAMETS